MPSYLFIFLNLNSNLRNTQSIFQTTLHIYWGKTLLGISVVLSHIRFPKDSTAICKAEVSTSTPAWWRDCCKLLMTLPLMTFLKLLPRWMASQRSPLLPSIHHHHQTSTPTHTLIRPSRRVTIAQQRLLPPAFTWLTPLSRCWIWSNHSQSSLNISFFKQNRGSKFHHSMTRSVTDNTIKAIPAYPEGAISGGTAGRWDYRQTERCQSPLVHISSWAAYTAQDRIVEEDHLIFSWSAKVKTLFHAMPNVWFFQWTFSHLQ